MVIKMLSRKQWQWLADHHAGVRCACVALLIISSISYAGLFYRAMILKGKVETTDASTTERKRAGCWERWPASKPDPYYLGPDHQVEGDSPIRYDQMNIFWLQSYRAVVFDVHVLDGDAKCFGAFMLDELTESNPSVVYLYDKERRVPVYRIQRLN
jgi:hypothetical protein